MDSFPSFSAVHRIAGSYFISAAAHIIWCFPFLSNISVYEETQSVWIIQQLSWNDLRQFLFFLKAIIS